MERLGSFVQLTGKGVGTTFQTAANAAEGATEVAQNGMDFGLFWGSKIAGALDGVYRGVDKALYTFLMDTSREEGEGGDQEEPCETVRGNGFGETDRQDVILRVEVARPWELKVAKIVSTVSAIIIAGLIIALCVIKVHINFSELLKNGRYFVGNLAIVCVLEALCLVVFFAFIAKVWTARKRHLVWSRRRLYISSCSFIILILQIINLGAMIGSMAAIEKEVCRWRNYSSAILGMVQWTCWNTTFMFFVIMAHNGTIWRNTSRMMHRLGSSKMVRGTSLMMDAPVRTHVYKLVLWVFFQVWPVLLLYSIWYFLTEECVENSTSECLLKEDTTAYIAMKIVSCGLYLVVYWFYSSRAAIDIESKSYAEMKLVRVIFGLQHSFVMPLFLVLMLSIILLTAIKLNSCWTYVELWLGIAPLQTSGVLCSVILAYFYMPVSAKKNTIIHSFLQELAWTEDSLEKSTITRNKMLEFCSSEELVTHPMFCVETSIRHLYLSNFVYSCTPEMEKHDTLHTTNDGDTTDGKLEDAIQAGCGNLKDALWLTNTASFQVLCEPSTDTVALLLWSQQCLWISFKGTSSSQNVKTDIDFFKVIHPPKRRVNVLGGFKRLTPLQSKPRVHRGFYKSWTGNAFSKTVLEKIRSFIASYDLSQQVPIHITGHSLGGALATLCAIDIATEHGDTVDLTVYTFGQPRVGNRAFSVEYDSLIVKHFSVIHDQDPVVRVPKGDYKRNGHRCIVNQKGDVIVSPTELEMHVLDGPSKIKDHFLEGYRKAWMTIVKQQFGAKQLMGIEPGRDGATRLCHALDLDRALMGSGLHITSLETYGEYPKSQEELEREKRKEKKKIVDDSDGTRVFSCCS